MWFAIGMVVGIFLTCFIVWLDKKFFIIDDLLFDIRAMPDSEDSFDDTFIFCDDRPRQAAAMRSVDSFDDGFIFCDDKPRGNPISFKDWEKLFRRKKHGR